MATSTAQPTSHTPHGPYRGPSSVLRRILATRPMFLAASVIPVLVGSLWGARSADTFDGLAFSLAVVAVVLVHAGVNLLNDVYDDASGTDRGDIGGIYPFTGGSRFIQEGLLNTTEMAALARLLISVACFAGIALATLKGGGVIWLGLAGIGLGVLYSAPPVRLCDRGLGEAAIALGFGVLPVVGAAWLQSGTVDPMTVLVSLPISLWITAVIVYNEIPDQADDAATGKRTLVVRFGTQGTKILYLGLQVGAFAAIAGLVMLHTFSPAFLLVPGVLLAMSFHAAQAIDLSPRTEPVDDAHLTRDVKARATIARAIITRGIKTTLATHALGGLWVAVWCGWV